MSEYEELQRLKLKRAIMKLVSEVNIPSLTMEQVIEEVPRLVSRIEELEKTGQVEAPR